MSSAEDGSTMGPTSALQDYLVHPLIAYLKRHDYALRHEATEIRLARRFGFCVGVARAVQRAHACRMENPDRRVRVFGKLVHNETVNAILAEMGVGSSPDAPEDADDLMLIPAVGIQRDVAANLRARGVACVDATCRFVRDVWRKVREFERDGFTAVIHGIQDHDETRIICSQIPQGNYLIVRNPAQADPICDCITDRLDAGGFAARFAGYCSPGLDPSVAFQRIGLANQTTMLASESREVEGMIRRAIVTRYGEQSLKHRFRALSTICPPTQDRQDAVQALLVSGCRPVLVVGGFESSNVSRLLETCTRVTDAYHVEGADDLFTPSRIRHKPLGDGNPAVVEDVSWLPDASVVIGVTAGASTPDRDTGDVIQRLLRLRGVSEAAIHRYRMGGCREEQTPGA